MSEGLSESFDQPLRKSRRLAGLKPESELKNGNQTHTKKRRRVSDIYHEYITTPRRSKRLAKKYLKRQSMLPSYSIDQEDMTSDDILEEIETKNVTELIKDFDFAFFTILLFILYIITFFRVGMFFENFGKPLNNKPDEIIVFGLSLVIFKYIKKAIKKSLNIIKKKEKDDMISDIYLNYINSIFGIMNIISLYYNSYFIGYKYIGLITLGFYFSQILNKKWNKVTFKNSLIFIILFFSYFYDIYFNLIIFLNIKSICLFLLRNILLKKNLFLADSCFCYFSVLVSFVFTFQNYFEMLI